MSPLLRFGALLFFLTTSLFSVSFSRGMFNSPDETANAFFIRQYVRTGSFRVAEPLNVIGEDIIHPRAVAIVKHDLAPGSFLGMLLLYGWIAKILGLWIVPLLTPLFATIASIVFYKLVRLLFDDRIARRSFFILLAHPAWIYYTARSLFPNVLFLSLLIIGLYLLFRCQLSVVSCQLSGIIIGSALAVRTSEAGWVLGALGLLWIFQQRQGAPLHARAPLVVLAGIVIAFLPIFYYNSELYGNPFYNGYSQIDSEAVPAAFAWHFQSRFLSTLFSLLLPFGINPLVLLQNAYQYLIWFFWWLAIPTILGVIMMARRKKLTTYNLQLTTYIFVTSWLVLYYGSWQFRDTTLSGPTLGTSFTRYWLPIFVFGTPFAAIALTTFQREWARFFLFGCMIFLSASLLFARTGESFAAMRSTFSRNRSIKQSVLDRTESSAVILTERTDKLFFPERRVMFNDPLDQKKIDRVVSLLANRVPIYYFTELQKHDIDFMNANRLAQYNVAWSGGEEIRGQRLYQLEQL